METDDDQVTGSGASTQAVGQVNLPEEGRAVTFDDGDKGVAGSSPGRLQAIVVGVIAVVIMVGALLLILSNVFKVVPG